MQMLLLTRKRKRLTHEERRLGDEAVLNEKRQKKMKVMAGCKETCQKQCRAQFSQQMRENINAEFWSLSWTQR